MIKDSPEFIEKLRKIFMRNAGGGFSGRLGKAGRKGLLFIFDSIYFFSFPGYRQFQDLLLIELLPINHPCPFGRLPDIYDLT